MTTKPLHNKYTRFRWTTKDGEQEGREKDRKAKETEEKEKAEEVEEVVEEEEAVKVVEVEVEEVVEVEGEMGAGGTIWLMMRSYQSLTRAAGLLPSLVSLYSSRERLEPSSNIIKYDTEEDKEKKRKEGELCMASFH